jgi:hypothetical protein
MDHAGLRLIPQILKPDYDSSFSTFFQIQPLSLVQKLSLVPCTLVTLSLELHIVEVLSFRIK